MYYIGDNLGSSDPSGIAPGVRILISRFKSPLEWSSLEGPFESIESLKSSSKLFSELSKSDSKRVNQILNPKNIIEIKDIIITETNNKVKIDFARVFKHIAFGEVKSELLKGLHFYDPASMEIISENDPDSNGVWDGIVRVNNSETKHKLEKDSTFFPKSWDLSRLFHECLFATRNMEKDKRIKFKYTAQTLSGIPVVIYLRKSGFATMFPKKLSK